MEEADASVLLLELLLLRRLLPERLGYAPLVEATPRPWAYREAAHAFVVGTVHGQLEAVGRMILTAFLFEDPVAKGASRNGQRSD